MIIITDDWLLVLIIWQNNHKAAEIIRCKMGRKRLLKCLHEWVIWPRASGWTRCLSGRTVNTKPAEIQSSETDPRPDNSRSDNFYCNSASCDATSRPCLDCTDNSNTIWDISALSVNLDVLDGLGLSRSVTCPQRPREPSSLHQRFWDLDSCCRFDVMVC